MSLSTAGFAGARGRQSFVERVAQDLPPVRLCVRRDGHAGLPGGVRGGRPGRGSRGYGRISCNYLWRQHLSRILPLAASAMEGPNVIYGEDTERIRRGYGAVTVRLPVGLGPAPRHSKTKSLRLQRGGQGWRRRGSGCGVYRSGYAPGPVRRRQRAVGCWARCRAERWRLNGAGRR